MQNYLSIEFEILKQDNTRYVDNDQRRLVNFGPIASFSEAKLVTSSGKHLEKIDRLHAVFLLHKLLTSNQQPSQSMYGFEESENTKRLELTNHKEEKGIFFEN